MAKKIIDYTDGEQPPKQSLKDRIVDLKDRFVERVTHPGQTASDAAQSAWEAVTHPIQTGRDTVRAASGAIKNHPRALAFSAMLLATGASGTYGYYQHLQHQKTTAGDPRNDMSVEELRGTVLEEKQRVERELDAADRETVAALRNWATAYQKREEAVQELLDIRYKVDQHQVPTLHDALETGVDILRQPAYQRPFGDIIKQFGGDVGVADVLLGGFLQGVQLPPEPTGDEEADKAAMARYKLSNPTLAKVHEQNQQIKEWVKPFVSDVLRLDYSGDVKNAAAAGLFKEIEERQQDVSGQLKLLESQVKDERNRKDMPRIDIDEKRQHEFFLKMIDEVQEHLRNTHTELTGAPTQNVDIVRDRLGRAVTVIDDAMVALERTIDQLNADIEKQLEIEKNERNTEAERKLAGKKFDRLDAQLELVEDQLKLALSIGADVGLLHGLTEGTTLRDGLVEHAGKLQKEAGELKLRLESGKPDGASAKSMAEAMEKLEEDSSRLEGRAMATFFQLDQDGGYSRYRRSKKEPRDFTKDDQRMAAIQQLGEYTAQLEEWQEVWKKASEAAKEFRAEKEKAISPAHIREKVRRLFDDLIPEEMRAAEKLVAAREGYQEKDDAYAKADDGYQILLEKMKGRKYQRPEKPEEAAKEYPEDMLYPYPGFPRGQEEKDKKTDTYRFKYRQPVAEPAEGAAPGRGSGNAPAQGSGAAPTGASFELDRSAPRDFPGYSDPDVPVETKFAYLWGKGGDSKAKGAIFASVEPYIGNEPAEVTQARIQDARKGFAMEGRTGLNCIDGAVAGMSAGEARVFRSSYFGMKPVNGQNIMVPMNKGRPGVGDKLIYTSGGRVIHVGTVLAVRDDGTYITGHGNYNNGYKVREGMRGSVENKQPTGWVPRAELVREAARREEMQHVARLETAGAELDPAGIRTHGATRPERSK